MWKKPNTENHIDCSVGEHMWVLTNDSNDEVILLLTETSIQLSGEARQKLIDLLNGQQHSV